MSILDYLAGPKCHHMFPFKREAEGDMTQTEERPRDPGATGREHRSPQKREEQEESSPSAPAGSTALRTP